MKKQVVVIHGGDPWRPYRAYIAELKREKAEADDFISSLGWKETLGKRLGSDFEVFNPRMPLKENALYADWRIWFEKLVPFLHDGVVLVGHSLGGIFLAKYLSENDFPKKIKALMLIAAPFIIRLKGDRNRNGGFGLEKDISRISRQVENVYLYHSTDDPIVDFRDMAKYAKALPGAVEKTLIGRKHIWQEEFPEIVSDIRNI
ncbi:alpha/beta hydrolase [Candidatus Parcubacteria bacterium]|nr:alpha/beta hydrolase [Candidatus Parcubacteria bacterium]